MICMWSLSHQKFVDLFLSYDWQINQLQEDLHVVVYITLQFSKDPHENYRVYY